VAVQQADTSAETISSDVASPSQEAVVQWTDLLRSASINQIYDRDYPASLEQLAKASDFHIAGKIAAVELAEPQPMDLAPAPASGPLPFEPDLVFRGVTIVLDDASVVGADAPDLGSRGGTMRVNVMLFSGPRTATTADDYIAKVLSTAPIGAAVVGFGRHAGVKSGGVNIGPYGLFVAADGHLPALAADPGLDRQADGRTYDMLLADARGG
jgi:hypothetical protein